MINWSFGLKLLSVSYILCLANMLQQDFIWIISLAFFIESIETWSLSCLTHNEPVTFWSEIILLSQLQFVVGLGDKVSPTDIEEGMRVG
jgi:hypothetical protein